MLSRTAENLFWMARYIERADATARLIEMGARMAMLPGSWGREEWRSVARATGAAELADSGVAVTREAIVQNLMLDPGSASSIRGCLERARANGKAVRTALTRDMWEALNDDWRKFESVDTASAVRDLPELLDWVKQKAMVLRGAIEGSMLRGERYDFVTLGSSVERADMILRLLDVKYYVLLPESEVVGGGRDHHQWTSLLHATSAMRAYHHTYQGDYAPWKIADFLILNRRFPRSVTHCYERIDRALGRLATAYGDERPCRGTAEAVLARLHDARMGEIFQEGLHEFVLDMLMSNRRVSNEIAAGYHF